MDLPARTDDAVSRRTDDALSHRTRARLLQVLDDLRRPAATVELAGILALHPNGVRVHLDRLREAGLVSRERIRQARGRPRDMWSIAPEARAGDRPPSGDGQLARWLARVISPGASNLRRLETTGRAIGRDLAPSGPGSPEDKLRAALVSLGFQPRREAARGGVVTYRLCNCPYRDAARDSPQVVCTLHRGITQGLLDALAPEIELCDFVPRDPDLGNCVMALGDGPAAGRART
jgi:predicted ArsR family transcriptional regulator